MAPVKPLALLTSAALMGSVVLTSGASLAKSHGPKVTISFMEAMSSGTLATTLQKLVSQFEAAHPTIAVNLQAEPSYTVLQQKEEAAIAAHNPPTIGQAYEDWAASYAASDAIVPLSSYVHGRNGVSQAYIRTMWKEVWNDQFLPNGKMYMWPFNKSDYIMYYNQNFLKRLGMQIPTNWNQLAAVSKAATSSKKDTWGFSFDTGDLSGAANGTFLALIMAQDYGATFYKNGKIAFDSPATVHALGLLRQLVRRGAAKVGTSYPGQTALDSNHSVFDLSTVASYYYIQSGKTKGVSVGVSAFPSGPAGNTNLMEGTNLVIFSRATTAERQAAWTFMKWLTQAKQTAEWAEGTGYLPVVRTAIHLMGKYYRENPYQKIAAQELAKAAPTPAVPGIGQAQDIWAATLQKILTTNVNLKQALQEGQQQAQQALAESKP